MSDEPDFDYYRRVISTEVDGEVLNNELGDLVEEAEATVADLRSRLAECERERDKAQNDNIAISEDCVALQHRLDRLCEGVERVADELDASLDNPCWDAADCIRAVIREARGELLKGGGNGLLSDMDVERKVDAKM